MSEHVGEAESRLELIEDQWAGGHVDHEFIRTLAAEAQVHATLALVEQQRIANLIAYWQLHIPRSAVEAYDHKYIEVSNIHTDGDEEVDTRIREALGLT